MGLFIIYLHHEHKKNDYSADADNMHRRRGTRSGSAGEESDKGIFRGNDGT
jgi:hypothetical protein